MRTGTPIGGLSAIAGAIALAMSSPANAQQYGGGWGGRGMMGYGGGWGSSGWMMLFGGFFWVILLVLGIAAVVWIVRASWHGGGHYPPRFHHGSSGLDILEERYARGEVDRDEYLQKKRDILGRGGSG